MSGNQEQKESYFKINCLDHSITFYVDKANSDPISDRIRKGDETLLCEPLSLLPYCMNKGTFMDIGANLGIFSFVYGSLGYHVVAFEANQSNYEQMEKSNQINNYNISLINKAIVDKSGQYHFVNNGPFGHLSTELLEKYEKYENIEGTSIDDWWSNNSKEITHISLIKMDIEGAELLGLKGMLSFLRHFEYPPIYTEANGWCLSWYNKSIREFINDFKALGYLPFVIDGNNTLIKYTSELQENCVSNYFMIHKNSPLVDHVNIVEGKSVSDDDFLLAAINNKNEAELYYYGWTILNEPRLLRNKYTPAFMDHYHSLCRIEFSIENYKKILNAIKKDNHRSKSGRIRSIFDKALSYTRVQLRLR